MRRGAEKRTTVISGQVAEVQMGRQIASSVIKRPCTSFPEAFAKASLPKPQSCTEGSYSREPYHHSPQCP